jgi:diacylglycerol kinase (ATP)
MPEPDEQPEVTPAESLHWRYERKSVLRSFRYAWDGLLFVFITQRHMRAHAAAIALVLIAAWGLGVDSGELLQLLMAMSLVLLAEMINTALEMVVDMIVDSYNPHAKTIKDIAAGAVLVASVYAVAVAGVVFFNNERLRQVLRSVPYPPRPNRMSAMVLVVLGTLALGLIIGYVKYRTRRGAFWRGGIISGHTALGFLLATSIAILTRDLAVTLLAVALAVLISQSRLQARIHSPWEIILGALMGMAIAALLFLSPAGYLIP